MLNKRQEERKPHLAIREEPPYINDRTKLFGKQFWLVDSNFCLSNSNSYKVKVLSFSLL